MGINQNLKSDVYEAAGFTDNIMMMYHQMKSVQTKLKRISDGSIAVTANTATPRERTFMLIIQNLIDNADWPRIRVLKSNIDTFCAYIEANFADYINPQ